MKDFVEGKNIYNSDTHFLFQSFATLSDKLEPLVEGVRYNRIKWLELAEQTPELIPENDMDQNSEGNIDENSEISEKNDSSKTDDILQNCTNPSEANGIDIDS